MHRRRSVDVPLGRPPRPARGRIAAGSPIQALEEIEDVMPLPASLVGDGTFFMLKVKGDSMHDAGIHDGDFVVIRKQDDATRARSSRRCSRTRRR